MDTNLNSDPTAIPADNAEEWLRSARHCPPGLAACIGPASFLAPRHVDPSIVAAWMEHGPFAFWLTRALRPRCFVELGTHTGFSFFAVCQAVAQFRLPTRCHAVDTWQGDEHAGFYGEDVFARVQATTAELYAGFAHLIRARFDDAVGCFGDGEIDLLHIDGRHRYDDVVQDFETWRPKLSPRAVVLFHDITERTNGFGVWRLWRELAGRHPSFEFLHGHGLGVLAPGPEQPAALHGLFFADDRAADEIRAAYARLGAAVTRQHTLLQAQAALAERPPAVADPAPDPAPVIAVLRAERDALEARAIAAEHVAAQADRRLAAITEDHDAAIDELSHLTRKLVASARLAQRATRAEADRDHLLATLTPLRGQLAEAEHERDAIRTSTIWRATAPLRRMLASRVAAPLRRMRRRSRHTPAAGPLTPILPTATPPPDRYTHAAWFARYQRDADHAAVTWRGATRFSIIMPVYKVRPDWLSAAIASVVAQTYPHWELICVDDHSADPLLSAILRCAAHDEPQVRVITLPRNQGAAVATNAGLARAGGDYVLFMDHDDVLEPHALARLGDAASAEDPDILYGDEVVTGEDIDEILGVQARPAFSHAYYLSHPYVVHPLAVRASLAREIGGLNTALTISQDIDFVLRALEAATKVTHVPDVLYRWRTSPGSAGHQRRAAVMATTCALKTAHLKRLGFSGAVVRPGRSFNTFSVRYFAAPAGRILAIIPTKNRAALLRQCIETLRSTTSGLQVDIVVIDHQSDEAETRDYLEDLRDAGTATVLTYQGAFNYSAINNYAVRATGAGYDYFLFLNNDIEATQQGWLHAMLDLAMRADVGAVGATLLYPDGAIQHSGVVIGLHGAAEHAFKTLPFTGHDPGYGASLHATRDYSAVTAACMLVPAEVFHAVGGYDERLVIGFNDTDLCLRIGALGWRILNCADAVLVHYESASRGKSGPGDDPHPFDSILFRGEHGAFLDAGDRYFSPLLALDNPTFVLDFSARLSPEIAYRTARDFLPRSQRATSAPIRADTLEVVS